MTVHGEKGIDRIPLRPGETVGPLAGKPLNEMLLGPSSAAWSREPGEAAPPPDGTIRNAKVLRMELQQA